MGTKDGVLSPSGEGQDLLPDGVFSPAAGEDEKPGSISVRSQKPLATRSTDYVEVGRLSVVAAEDGGVRIGGEQPPSPAPGLTLDNLICTEDPSGSRERCAHYRALLTEAPSGSKGFAKPMEIRRYCIAHSSQSELFELGDLAVYACESRKPQDLVSIRLIRDFEDRQRREAAEASRESGVVDL